MPLARSVLKNLKGSPIPAKASTRLPRSDATDTSSALRWADSTGLPCAAMAGGNRRGRGSITDDDHASVRASCGGSGARKGPAGKHEAVAEAAVAVDHDQRGILGDRGILKAVIHQDHTGALRPAPMRRH